MPVRNVNGFAGRQQHRRVVLFDPGEVLRQHRRDAVAVARGHLDRRGFQPGLRQMERPAVGEDRQGRLGAERLDARGRRGPRHRLAGLGQRRRPQLHPLGVAAFVEAVGERAPVPRAVDDAPADGQLGPRRERPSRGDHAVAVERVLDLEIDRRRLLLRILEHARGPQHDLPRALFDDLDLGDLDGREVPTVDRQFDRTGQFDDDRLLSLHHERPDSRRSRGRSCRQTSVRQSRRDRPKSRARDSPAAAAVEARRRADDSWARLLRPRGRATRQIVSNNASSAAARRIGRAYHGLTPSSLRIAPIRTPSTAGVTFDAGGLVS